MAKGVCMVKGGMHGEWSACMVKRDIHGQQGCAWPGSVRGRRDSHCSGRYASYWNAFLFPFYFLHYFVPVAAVPGRKMQNSRSHIPCDVPFPVRISSTQIRILQHEKLLHAYNCA